MDISKLFHNTGSIIVVALGPAIFIKVVLGLGDKYLSNEQKENTTLWLLGANEDTWANQFCLWMDAIFGKNHLSQKCFFRSSVASIVVISILYFFFFSIGVLGRYARVGGSVSLTGALSFGIILNLIPDYISLLETRLLLHFFKKINSLWSVLVFLLFDLLFSGAIIWLSILLYGFFNQTPVPTLAELIGVFSFYSLFFFSTFFTSILVWLYFLSSVIMRIFCKTFLKNFLNTEEKPFQSISIVAATLTLFISLPPRYLFKNDTINEWWCSYFPSTCPSVYRLNRDFPKKMEYFSKLCSEKNYIACHELGDMYYQGYEVDQNYKQAFNLFRKSCNKNIEESCYNLGQMYLNGFGVYKDYKNAVYYFEHGCTNSDFNSCTSLGLMYERGLGVNKNYKVAISLYEKACYKGNLAVGCHNLATMYYEGKGVIQNYKNSVILYEESCDKGMLRSCANLGSLYKNGLGVRKNCSEAISIFRKICDTDTSFCWKLGIMYEDGCGLVKDIKQANILYEKSCHQGSAMGCFNLGRMYRFGIGVEKDFKKTAILFQKSCDAGKASVCLYLGKMYQEGNGVVKDQKKSALLFQKAQRAEEDIPIISNWEPR